MKGKEADVLLAIPVLFIFVTVLVAFVVHKGKGMLQALGTGIMAAGAAASVLAFVLLAPLLIKGTDGLGGLVAIILPFFILMGSLVVGAVLTSVGGLAQSAKKSEKLSQEISAEGQAVLNRHPDFFPSQPVVSGPDWRDFARAAGKQASRP